MGYLKTYKKKIKKDKKLEKSVLKAIEILKKDPFHNSLKTHKVDTKRNKDIYSSSITGDWRIGWIFDENRQTAIIICLEIGTHSGAEQIYKTKS